MRLCFSALRLSRAILTRDQPDLCHVKRIGAIVDHLALDHVVLTDPTVEPLAISGRHRQSALGRDLASSVRSPQRYYREDEEDPQKAYTVRPVPIAVRPRRDPE